MSNTIKTSLLLLAIQLLEFENKNGKRWHIFVKYQFTCFVSYIAVVVRFSNITSKKYVSIMNFTTAIKMFNLKTKMVTANRT